MGAAVDQRDAPRPALGWWVARTGPSLAALAVTSVLLVVQVLLQRADVPELHATHFTSATCADGFDSSSDLLLPGVVLGVAAGMVLLGYGLTACDQVNSTSAAMKEVWLHGPGKWRLRRQLFQMMTDSATAVNVGVLALQQQGVAWNAACMPEVADASELPAEICCDECGSCVAWFALGLVLLIVLPLAVAAHFIYRVHASSPPHAVLP